MVSTISKEDLAKLDQEVFEGQIIVVETDEEAEKACEYLAKHDTLGFDTETKPAFQKGVKHKIALMQISTLDTCFLFRLNKIGIPDCLVDILTNKTVKMIGLSLRDDFSAIRKRKEDIKPSNFIDVQVLSDRYGIEDNSLQRIYAIMFGKRISKGQRLSNWEAEVLSEAQKMYASIDAWACLKIYNMLLTMKMVK